MRRRMILIATISPAILAITLFCPGPTKTPDAIHKGKRNPKSLFIPKSSFHLRPCLIFLVKPRVTAFETDFLPANPHPFHVAANVENVSIGGEDCRLLARFD